MKNFIKVLILCIIVGIVIFYMPEIYKKLQEEDVKPIENTNKKIKNEKKQEITMDSEIVKNLTYPIMRNDSSNINSYYELDSFTFNDMSNSDILYNAFIDLYEGYIIDHESVGCTNNSKEFASSYLKSRIHNVIDRNINYIDEDFNVYSNSDYIGLWKYNSSSDSYIYYGNCNDNKSNITYYDIMYFYSLEVPSDNTIYLYYYIAFSKIEGNTYTIYSDAHMNYEILKGNIPNDINEVYNSIDKRMLKKYRYIFKKGSCTYDNYCFNKGEWIND